MTLQERIKRDNMEDQIYLGSLVAKATQGEFGDLFRLICNGVMDEALELSSRETSRLPADRYLGRIEGINQIQSRLVLMMDIKENLLAEKKSSRRVSGAESD